MTTRPTLLIVVVLAIFGISLSLRADPPTKKDDTKSKRLLLLQQKQGSSVLIPNDNVVPLMHRKLDCAKKILEGLAIEDHDMIAKNARSMKLFSMEAGWNVVQTPEYTKQSRDFRRACESIESAAKAENVNRAALGYVSLTVRCVECHQYLRDNKIILTSNVLK